MIRGDRARWVSRVLAGKRARAGAAARFAVVKRGRARVADACGASLIALALSACGTPLSGGQPAHVAPAGTVRVAVATEVLVPTGVIQDTFDGARTLARALDDGRSLSEGEQRQLVAAGTTLAIMPPSFPTWIDAAYGVVPDLEVDLRLATGAFWRLGGRYQLLHQARDRLDLSLGLAVGRSAFELPMPSWLSDYVRLDDFVRWSFELPLALGQRSDYLRWWVGPRLVYWRSATAVSLRVPQRPIEVASARAGGLTLGGQAGLALGYRKVFLGAEVTLAQAVGGADLRYLGATTEVPLGSFILCPALMILGEF